MRLLSSLLATAVLLLGAQALPALAAEPGPGPDPLDVRQGGGLPDVPAIAQAYGELSVFVLDVAAGHDGTPRDAAAEQAFAAAFAQQLAASYPSLAPDQQQALGGLPALRARLRQAWPTLPPEPRRQLQQQWADAVRAALPGVPCDAYDARARAYLLPADPAHDQELVDRLVRCWDEHPELAKGRDGRDRAAERARRQAASGGDHAAFVGLMNAETTRHAGTMNMLSIMSGDGYRRSVK
jgi:hypothetical protein